MTVYLISTWAYFNHTASSVVRIRYCFYIDIHIAQWHNIPSSPKSNKANSRFCEICILSNRHNTHNAVSTFQGLLYIPCNLPQLLLCCVCCGYAMDFQWIHVIYLFIHILQVFSMALENAYDCPNSNEVILKDIVKIDICKHHIEEQQGSNRVNISWYILYTLDISRSYTTWLCPQPNNYSGKTSAKLCTHERHPIGPRHYGRAMGCLSWVIQRIMTAIYRERTVLHYRCVDC